MLTFKQFIQEAKDKKEKAHAKLGKKVEKLQQRGGKLSKKEVMTILNYQGGIGRAAVEKVHGKRAEVK